MTDTGEEDLKLVADMEALYRKFGLTVYNTGGQLKSTYELITEMAPVYNKATAAEKAYIAEEMAGKHQAQVLTSIFQNYETAIDATTTAMNSNGSATKENEVYLNSIQGSVQAFRTEFEKLSKSLISRDLIKGVIDLGTALLKITTSDLGGAITRGATALVGLKVALSGLGKVVNTFEGIKKAFEEISLLSDKSKLSISGMASVYSNSFNIMRKSAEITQHKQIIFNVSTEETIEKMKEWGLSVKGVVDQNSALNAINTQLNASTLILNGTLLAGAAVIGFAWQMWSKYQQKLADARQEAREQAETIAKQDKENRKLISSIVELKETLGDENSTLMEVNNAKKELADIQENLIEQYGKEASGIDLVNDSTNRLTTSIKSLTQAQKEKWLEENKQTIERAKGKLGKEASKIDINEYGDISGVIGNFAQKSGYDVGVQAGVTRKSYQPSSFIGSAGGYFADTNFFVSNETKEETLNFFEKFNNYLKENKDEILANGTTLDQYNNALKFTQDNIDKTNNKYKDEINILEQTRLYELETAKGYEDFMMEIQELGDRGLLNKEKVEEILTKYPEVANALGLTTKTTQDLANETNKTAVAVENFLNRYKDDEGIQKFIELQGEEGHICSLNREEYEKVQNALGEYNISIDDVIQRIKDKNEVTEQGIRTEEAYETAIKNLSDSIENIQSAYQTLITAQEEYNEYGFISIDTLQALLDLGYDYYQYLIDENGQLNLNSDAIKNLTQARLNEIKSKVMDLTYSRLLAIEAVHNGNATEEQIKLYSALKDQMDKTGDEAENFKDKINNLTAALLANPETKAATEEAIRQMNETIALVESATSGIGSSLRTAMNVPLKETSSTREKETKEWWETELEAIKNQFKYSEITVDEYIGSLESLLNRLDKGSDAWRQINEELQKQKLSKVESDYKAGTISLSEYINKLKELIKTYKEGTDAWNNLASKIRKALQDQAKEQKDVLQTAESAAEGLIDDEIKKLEDLRKAEEDRYNKLIEAKKNANDETEKEIELAKLQETLANAQKEKNKRVDSCSL